MVFLTSAGLTPNKVSDNTAQFGSIAVKSLTPKMFTTAATLLEYGEATVDSETPSISARCPPALAPKEPIRFGSILYIRALRRKNRTALCTSSSIEGHLCFGARRY